MFGGYGTTTIGVCRWVFLVITHAENMMPLSSITREILRIAL